MNPNFVRETIEWSRMWWAQAEVPNRRRVLLIGDSITVGYAPHVAAALGEGVSVDYWATSRSLNDPCFTRELHYVLSVETYEIIHFNNGLHGFHLTGEEYGYHLAKALNELRHASRGARLTWAASTPVTLKGDAHTLDPEKNKIVTSRNEIATALMQREKVEVDDLYAFVVEHPEVRCEDGYHYFESGQKLLGNAVATFLKRYL
jgi:lysophospholipase L1-like esterase